MGDMETFDESETAVSMEMVLPMDMVSEEVVTQDEGGADSDGLTAAMDSLTSLPSVSILSKFGKEFRYLEDSSEDEHDPDPNPNPAAGRPYVSGQNSAEEGSGSDVWTGSARDDCLCWECGERFHSLERLMVHFRKHEACVRCNMCHVTFRRVVSLSMHLDNVHNNVDLYCAPCSRLFHSKWDLNEHLGKHSEPGSEPEPCAEPQEEIEVHLVTSDTEGEPMPKPVSRPVSVPVSTPVPVSVPMSVAVPRPVPVSAPMSVPKSVPVSAPIPVTVYAPKSVLVPRPVSVSGPISVSIPNSVPVSGPGPVPVTGPSSVSIPKCVPVSRPVPVSGPVPVPAPVPLSVPMSVPIFLPVSIPLSLPVSVPIPTSVPGPFSVPIPMSVPVPMAISTPSPSSTAKDQGSPLGDSTLPELVARDHTYNNSCKADNGAAAGTYTLRHTHRLTKALPESAHQEKEARVAGGGRDRHVEDFAVGKAVKLDASPLTPPLLRSLASSEQDGKMEQGGMDPCSGEVPWDGEPIEEDDLEHSGEEVNSDGFMSPGDSSEYDPGTASDASSESISSGNSSGSSYTPNKRGGKKVKTRRCLAIKRPCKAESSQVAIAPARQPVVSDSVNFGQTIRHQQKPQPNIQAPAKQNVTDTSAPGHNKALARPVFGPSRMYACDLCREVFPEQVSYRRHHCPVKAAIMSWRGPASIPAPAIQNPTAAPIPAPGALRTIAVPSASSLVSTPGQVLNSGSGVLKVAQTGVPCTIQNPTLVSSLPVASGPVFTLPSIMLPSPSPSVQSGSRPIMATVVFNGNGSAGRVTRLVLQSQGLTFPTHTLSETRPIRLSVPTQANAPTAGQASPSMQLPNLMMIQPQALVKSSHLTLSSIPSLVPAPGRAPTPSSAPKPDLIPAPVPITAPTPTSVAGSAPISAPRLTPATAPITIPIHITAPAPKTVPTPIAAPTPKTIPTPKTVSTPITASFHIPALTPLNATFPAPNPGPLKILGMFANRSQEVALGKRLEKSWRSKGVFLCRQCGAISRQPSLGVRHRYLHRGSRRHRCHCGRTFLHLLHLLRHHVQHAEATRFVCAPCGRTFSGARCLARHKQDQEGKRKRRRKRKKRERSRKDCHAPFSCDCGQIFHRPTAFLWHKLKNPKQQGASLKGTQGNYPADDTASQIETCPL
ncbi:mucin-5AC [Conger conger]|uniref:mucin-5AC n=1 Tax=Conger conger TaxID=82655 RepID=UPI002A5A3369|nr:mucin-5AC [Conger conger]